MIPITTPDSTEWITPRWAGKGIAVHKPVIESKDNKWIIAHNRVGVWHLTHIPTGLGMCRFLGNLDRAIAFASEWDEAFADVRSKVPAQLKQEFFDALKRTSDEH